LYPLSEDILAISGLLAITREDWSLAVEILQDLVSVQDNRVQPMTYQMLARALACNLDVTEVAQRRHLDSRTQSNGHSSSGCHACSLINQLITSLIELTAQTAATCCHQAIQRNTLPLAPLGDSHDCYQYQR
jgi:hypothetical protein